MIYFSKLASSFYSSEIHGENIPSDAVEITDEYHTYLLDQQSEGKLISSDETGRPILVEPIVQEVIPSQISRAQGKVALIQAGLWADVLAHVEHITDPTQKALAEVALNDTQYWRRDSVFLNTMAAALAITQADMDALFKAASKIQL